MESEIIRNIYAFRQHLICSEKAQATIEKYLRDLKAFLTWKGERKLNKELTLQYKSYLMKSYQPASVNSILSSLNSFFTFLKRHDCKVKTLRIQKRIFASEDRELTKKEYEKLLDAAWKNKKKRLYYLLQTISSTGIRVSELRAITIEAVRSGKATIYCKGKMRLVILPQMLCRMLQRYCKEEKIEHGAVFITKSGKNVDRSNIWHELKRLSQMAGVAQEKVFPHNFRHLFARTYYAQQRDVVRLADILGHANINTTRIYTMESGKVHQRQLQQMGLLRLERDVG